MALSVVVPIRVRVDHAGLTAEPDALGDAVAEAATRALANARRAVFEPRGGYARPQLAVPEITVYGKAAGLLAAEDLAGLTARIEGAVARAAAAAGLDRPPPELEGAPEVLRPGDAAPYNPARDGELIYVVDSYGDPSREPGVAAAAKARGGRRGKREREGRRLLECDNTPDALLAAGNRYVEQTVRQFLGGEYTRFAPLGIHFRERTTQHPRLAVLSVQLTADGLQHSGSIIFQQGLRVASAEFDHGQWTEIEGSAKVDRVMVLDQVSSARIADPKTLIDEVARFLQREKALTEWFKNLSTKKLRTGWDRKALQYLKQYGEIFFYEAQAAALVGAFPNMGAPFRLFRVGKSIDLVLFDARFNLDVSRLNIVPLTEAVVLSENRRRGGTGQPGGTETGVSGGGTSKECGDQCFGYKDTATYSLDGVEPVELITGPFECEPPVSEFGQLGRRMQELMDDIAITLRMQNYTWSYVGAFMISAARVLAARSRIVARTVDIGSLQDAKPAPQGRGNAGDAEVLISRSPAIQALRELAAVVPTLQYLDECIWSTLGPSSSFLSDCGRKRFGASWILHYRKEFMPASKEAVYGIFTETCQVALIQLLSASGSGIQWMLENFDPYFESIEPLLLGAVKRLSELQRMRQHLLQAEASNLEQVLLMPNVDALIRRRTSGVKQRSFADELKAGLDASARVGYQGWRDAREWWRGDLISSLPRAAEELQAQRAVEGVVERQPDGTFAVRETQGGADRLWTREELERTIAFVTQIATSIDPLVKHMHNLESSVAAFRGGRETAYKYVHDLLERMRTANRDAILDVWEDRMYSFRTAKFTESWEGQTVAGTGVRLGNIHAMANQAIGDAFEGSWLFVEGLKYLFDSELGRESLLSAAELFATIGAFVLFAPLGLALSAGFAAHRYMLAQSHLDLVEGLIDPDDIMTYAEAELEMFMSHFEIALLVIPEAGTIARGVMRGGRELLEQGFRQGAKQLAKDAVAHMMTELAKSLKGQLLKSFVHQLVTTKAMEPVLQLALEPVFKVLQEEAAFGQGGGMPAEIASLAEFEAEYGDAEIELEPLQSLENEP